MRRAILILLLSVSSAAAQHNWEGLNSITASGQNKTQDRCGAIQLKQIGTFTGAARPFTIKITRNATGTTLMDSNWICSPNGSWTDTGGNGGGAVGVFTGFGMPQVGDVMAGSYPQADGSLGSVTVLIRLGTSQAPGATVYTGTSNVKFNANPPFPGHNGCLLFQHTFDIGEEPPAECGWSMDWSLRSLCPGGTTAEHEIELLVDGVHYSGSPATIPPGQMYISGDAGDTSPTGTVIVLKIDGVVKATHTVQCPIDGQPPPSPNVWVYNGTIAESCEGSPTPAPTTTPSGTPPPAPTPTPAGSPPPNPTPPPGPSPYPSTHPPVTPHPGTTGVTVVNPNDFYAPVLAALNEAGQGIPNVNYTSDGFLPVDDSNRGDLDNLKGKVQEGIDEKEKITGNFRRIVQSINDDLQQLPDSVGQETVIHWGTDAFGYEGNLDLSEWDTEINLLRTLLLWLLTLSMAYFYLEALTYQGD